MTDQQAGKKVLTFLLTHLDQPISAADVALGAPCYQATASQYLRSFALPGYTCTRIGNNYVISRDGRTPRTAKIRPIEAKPDPMAGFEKFMASEKTIDKMRDLLRAAYLAGSQE